MEIKFEGDRNESASACRYQSRRIERFCFRAVLRQVAGNMGAEVIKVEKPGIGDKARSWGPFPQDLPHPEKSGLFLFLNTNKSGITLNIETDAGLKILKSC